MLIDVPAVDVPLALARLHWATPVGQPVTIERPVGFEPAVRWEDLVGGAGFVPAEGARSRRNRFRRARTLPDTVGPGMRVLVCGLNPSLVAADAGYGYAGPTNRFWPAAVASGLVTHPRDPLGCALHDRVGMTDLVKRATPNASMLGPEEYRAGADRVRRLVEWLQPGLVLFVGLAGWRAAVDRGATAGLQPEPFGGVPAYVMPSTSGLNAHTSAAELAGHMAEALTSIPAT